MSFLIFYILVNLFWENKFLKSLLRNMSKKKQRQIFVDSNGLESILPQGLLGGKEELHNFNNPSIFFANVSPLT